MKSRFLLIIAFLLSTTIFSCQKENAATCITPNKDLIQGSWKQDFTDIGAFQPPPEWEKIEFRNDSFFMRIRLRTDMLTDTNCYQYTWLEYTKGVYNIDSVNIHFNGIFTDSNYAIKVSGCHSTGNYQPVFGFTSCGAMLTLKVLLKSNSIPEERLKINMYK